MSHYARFTAPRPGPGYNLKWAATFVDKFNQFLRGLEGPFEIGNRLITKGAREKSKITYVTSATYTILRTDHTIDVNFAGAVTLTLPLAPRLGFEIVVQDSSGAARANAISLIPPAAITLNGISTPSGLLLDTDYGRWTTRYNGTLYLLNSG